MAYQSRPVTWLDACLKERRIAEGFDFLKRYDSVFVEMKPTEPEAAGIVVRLAQWVDLGYRDVEFLDRLVKRFPTKRRASMPLKEFLQLRMAEAFCAMGEENLDRAIELLGFVHQAERELADQGLAAIAHFWKGRSHRKKGEYDQAMLHVVRGRE